MLPCPVAHAVLCFAPLAQAKFTESIPFIIGARMLLKMVRRHAERVSSR